MTRRIIFGAHAGHVHAREPELPAAPWHHRAEHPLDEGFFTLTFFALRRMLSPQNVKDIVTLRPMAIAPGAMMNDAIALSRSPLKTTIVLSFLRRRGGFAPAPRARALPQRDGVRPVPARRFRARCPCARSTLRRRRRNRRRWRRPPAFRLLLAAFHRLGGPWYRPGQWRPVASTLTSFWGAAVSAGFGGPPPAGCRYSLFAPRPKGPACRFYDVVGRVAAAEIVGVEPVLLQQPRRRLLPTGSRPCSRRTRALCCRAFREKLSREGAASRMLTASPITFITCSSGVPGGRTAPFPSQGVHVVPVNGLHVAFQDVRGRHAQHVHRVLGRGVGRRVAEFEPLQVVDRAAQPLRRRDHVDAFFHALETGRLRAEDLPSLSKSSFMWTGFAPG